MFIIAGADSAGDGGGIAVGCIGTVVLVGVDHEFTNDGFDDIGDGMVVGKDGGCGTIGLLGLMILSKLDVDLWPNPDWSFAS